MGTQAFGISIEMESSILPVPCPVLQTSSNATTTHSSVNSPGIEMKALSQDARKESTNNHGNTTETPAVSKSPNDLEMSRPSSPQGGSGVDIVQTFWNPYMNRFRLAAACVISLGLGMNDSSSGALLAYIEKQAVSLFDNMNGIAKVHTETTI